MFRLRKRYFATTYALAAVISGGVAVAIGDRGPALGSQAVLLLAPTFLAMATVGVRIFPLDIEVVRPGWTPGESDDDREVERAFEQLRELDPVLDGPEPQVPAPMPAAPRDDASGRLPLSVAPDPPVSLEGVVIAIAFAALIAWHVYAALEPHVGIRWTPSEPAVQSASPQAR